ncbi:MAG: outer membrane beta-barrel protein [Elusimicrobia bacterium]|nr:outer membrane beta-barrel protein [Elusimicrobiota bacterium]
MIALRGATAAFLAFAALLPAAAQAPGGLAIVSFGDYLWLRVDGRAVAIEPGSPGYEIPLGARTFVAQGAATLLFRDALIRVDAGDDFTVSWVDGQARLLVNSGAVSVSEPGRAPVNVEAGRFISLTGPNVSAAAPASPLPAAPTPPPAAAVTTPFPAELPIRPAGGARPAPEGWDPLSALVSGLSKLSSLRTPQVRLVLELHPFYRLRQTYDTNIYLVPADKANGTRAGGGVLSSWVTVNQLGTTWKLPLNRRHALSGLYSARVTNYSTQGKTNDAVDQQISGQYAYSGQKGVSATLAEDYSNTEDPAFSEQVARQRRTMVGTSFSLDVDRGRAFVYGFNASHQLHKYLDPTLANVLNRTETTIGGTAGVKLAPKTRLFLAYSRGLIHYSAGRKDHSRSHRLGGGLSGVFTARLSGQVQADVYKRRYENRPPGQPRDISSLVTSVALKYKAGRRTDSQLRVFRSVNEATFRNSRYYVSSGASADVAHTWRKITGTSNLAYTTDRYPEATTLGAVSGTRRDDTYSAGLGVAYQMRTWLSMDASYQRAQRFSFFLDQFDYAADRYGVGLNVQF